MITTILAIAFLLGICMFIHELGHFLMGKLVGVDARIFSIGFGRGIFFKKKGRTIYQIAPIPLGAYVQFYGDDITKSHDKVRKGDFFSVGPWKRMLIVFGGPLFSLLLGFILIFILLMSGWRPTTNEIKIPAEKRESAAHKAGLRDGDRILEVNGVKTNYFEKVNLNIALSANNDIDLKVDRNGEILDIRINAVAHEAGSPLFIDGMEPKGEKYLIVKKGKLLENTFLKDGDKILTVNGQKVAEIDELGSILNTSIGKKVEVIVERESRTLFNPNKTEKITVQAPVQTYDYFRFTDIRDLQTEKTIPVIEIGQWDEKPMHNLFIDGKSYMQWEEFRTALNKISVNKNKKIKFRIGAVDVEAKVEKLRRGLLGISLETGIITNKMEYPNDIFSIAALTFDYSVIATQSTLLGLYRIVEGKLSFRKSVSGPVKIMKMTAESIKYGWDVYWMLFAQITIVLGIMNLLPIPVLDGGHMVIYLIEAVYKPIPTKIIVIATRIGVVLLIATGIYVILLDIWDVFISGLLSK